MNDEIKEILDYLKDKNDYIEDFGISYKRIHIDNGDLKTLLDYIINLQQENSKLEIALQNIQEDYDRRIKEIDVLKKELNNKEFVFVGTAQNKIRDFIKNLVKEKNDYKSRCEKAIDKLTIKQARFINEKNYVLDDNDLDEIMLILQNERNKGEKE